MPKEVELCFGGPRIPGLAHETRFLTRSPRRQRSLNNMPLWRHSPTCASLLVPLVLTDDDGGKRPAQLHSNIGEFKPHESEGTVSCGLV